MIYTRHGRGERDKTLIIIAIITTAGFGEFRDGKFTSSPAYVQGLNRIPLTFREG